MRSNPEEARLARAAVEGDGQAFAQLYDRYEKPIYNYCLRLLGNEHDAQDATQDAFLKVMRRLPKLGDRELEFGPYVYTAARNASYDMIGKRKRATPVDEFADGVGEPLGDGPALEEDPLRSALLAAEQDSVRAANARLPERQREVLALREIEGMSYEDIADLLEMNSNSVAQLISRARIRLRAELRGEAAGAIAGSTPECDRALPLLARRQDGRLDEGADSEWLDSHLAECTTCPIAAEAMAEAGLSYRAWAPVLPAAWLFRDTLAKAADLVGADWSHVQRPGGDAARAHPGDAARGTRPNTGTPDGRGSEQGGTASGGIAARLRRRRGLLAGVGAVLILILAWPAVNSLGGKGDEQEPPATPPPSEQAEPSPPASKTTAAKPEPMTDKAGKGKGKKSDPAPEQPPPSESPAPAPATSAPTPTPAPASTPAAPEPQRTARPARDRPTRGSGSWGGRTQPRPQGTVTPDPAPTPQPPPAPPTEPPTQPEPPADPPVGSGDQPPGATDPTPPTPCLVRVC